MRTFIAAVCLVMTISLTASSQVFGKKKSKEEPANAKVDSLTKANGILTQQADSLSKTLEIYIGMYTAIKEKVMQRDFDPANMGAIIDSLKASRDSAFAKLTLAAKPAVGPDSVAILKAEILKLKTTLDTAGLADAKKLESLTAEEIERAKAITALKQLRELVDAKILTDAEFIAAKKRYLEKL